MARFYANIKGSRGEATRMGNKNSGLNGHIRGWNLGIRVEMSADNKTDEDVVRVYLTSGSGGEKHEKYLGCYTVDDLDKEITVIKK